MRRSTRNKASSSVVEAPAPSKPAPARAKKVAAANKPSQPAAAKGQSQKSNLAKVKDESKRSTRKPLSSRRDPSSDVGSPELHQKSEPTAILNTSVDALKEFADGGDLTLDPEEEEVDDATRELVSNWQARAEPAPTKQPSLHPQQPSSSLPPSSPLPPHITNRAASPDSLSSLSDFNPPSIQQEARFHGTFAPDADDDNVEKPEYDEALGDASFSSIVSDEFGFFAAQPKIKEKRRAARAPRVSDSTVHEGGDTSFEGDGPSFSGRAAFSTPYTRRRARSPDAEPPAKLARRSRASDKSDPTSSPAEASAKGTKKAKRVQEEDSDEDDEGGRASKPRKVSGSSATSGKTRKPRKKAGPTHDHEEEEIDLNAVVSADEGDEATSRDGKVRAQKQRVAALKELDNYELEVEDVIVF
ncbi:hypothetical protein DL93DRAFT_820937 [Clavulina sp. PMI_390]|nr:hypothetical protein DL93DRAFT_820937 [Clavulina sp. PMI_390]